MPQPDSDQGAAADEALRDRLAAIRSEIADAALRVDRTPEELTLIVVTKFHPASLVASLSQLGVRDVGENRHQEAQQKAAELSQLDLRWHFIGQLQTKKARQAAQYAHAIHSIDRDRLVTALTGLDRRIDAFVQVNLTADPSRGGIAPDELMPLVEKVLSNDSLHLRGVMAVAPLPEEEAAERAFARLRGYSEQVRQLAPEANAISAGMTHDFAAAIAEGATHLRIGSAITGNRALAG